MLFISPVVQKLSFETTAVLGLASVVALLFGLSYALSSAPSATTVVSWAKPRCNIPSPPPPLLSPFVAACVIQHLPMASGNLHVTS